MIRAGLLLAVVVCVAVLLPAAASAQGCSMCRTYTEGAEDAVVQGINRSAIFMVSVPILLVTGVGGWLAYQLREDEAIEDDGSTTPILPFRRDET